MALVFVIYSIIHTRRNGREPQFSIDIKYILCHHMLEKKYRENDSI